MAYASNTQTIAMTFGQRFTEFRVRATALAAQRKVYRTTVYELDALSNRDLADLGISRTGIRAIAYEAAYGDV